MQRGSIDKRSTDQGAGSSETGGASLAAELVVDACVSPLREQMVVVEGAPDQGADRMNGATLVRHPPVEGEEEAEGLSQQAAGCDDHGQGVADERERCRGRRP